MKRFVNYQNEVLRLQNKKNLMDELKKLNETHTSILSTLSLLVQPEIEKRLSHIFTTPGELLAFKLSDGNTSSADIAQQINVSRTTIANWWQKWEENFSIVETSGYRNPYKAKYTLVELALLFGQSVNSEE